MSDDTKKPWEDDDFDAEKAWNLIQNLRKDKNDLTDSVATERQARLAAEKKAEDTDPDGKIKAAEERAAAAEKRLNVQAAIIKFPTLAGYEDLLVGDDEEAVMKVAERLASLNVPKKDETDEDKDKDKDGEKPNESEKLDSSGRPIPALKPGHGGNDSTPIDPAAIALAARRH